MDFVILNILDFVILNIQNNKNFSVKQNRNKLLKKKIWVWTVKRMIYIFARNMHLFMTYII